LRWSWQSSYALAVIPLALILVITAADIAAPEPIHLGSLLVAAPAITASFAGPLFTSVIGLLAVVSQVLIGAHDDELGTQNVQAQVIALALVSAFVVLFCYLRNRDRQELVRVRTVSEAAQRALLRPPPRRLGPLRLATSYLAAQAEAHIGGDLYGAVRTSLGTRLIIGDVRGKGLPAVSEAALLLGAFREAARRARTLPELAVDLEESVGFNQDGPSEGGPDVRESFITAAIFDIPDDEPVLKMVNCGHPPPLIMRDGRVTALDSARPAPPLGLGGLCDPCYTVETFAFKAGDVLLLYTDGVIEARNPAGTFYPLADRIVGWGQDAPQVLLCRVRDDLLAHVGGRLGDDAAMIAIRRLPAQKRAVPPLPREATSDRASPDGASPDRASPDGARPDRARPEGAASDGASSDRASAGGSGAG
jgi:serine phosphatase RsbU (regulator of sigma subunit)